MGRLMPGEVMSGERAAYDDQLQPIEPSEDERVAAVHRYGILDTPSETSFDRITALASRLLDVPIALISIVDQDRIWFKSKHGLDVSEVERSLGICSIAFERDAPLVIPDLLADARFHRSPLTVHPYGIRFYAGVPLITPEGIRLGTLCTMDRKPRQITPEAVGWLSELGAMTVDHVELRFSARQAVTQMADALDQKAAALERAELLKQETDHRIMNSLQLVASLLQLQSRSVVSEEAIYHLRSAASRVSAVAGVHRHFYLDPTIDRVSCLEYLRQLCGGLSEMLRLDDLVVTGQDFAVAAKTVVPVGLIVNELVTNAAKYGGGRIEISLRANGRAGFMLSVEDDGAGFSEDATGKAGKGLGMRVVRVLAQQIGGRLSIGTRVNGRGARVCVQVANALKA